MPAIHQPGLNAIEVEHFIELGYLKLEHAFSETLARVGRARLWAAAGRSPEELRDEVEQELEELTDEAADEESARMAEREETGVDEPNGD